MPSPYESENFAGRVAFAASYIAGRREATRTFDTCFEMYDGAVVATALYRRVTARPDTKLAAHIWSYLSREIVEEGAARFAHVPTRDLPKLAREVRMARASAG
ncbi:MAG: hypothetical protein DI556_13285 [Rhodovulum sulfidophilum]|uniref:Uncharacterized protein n=1 Tax=Rhodovulum sulfidophilum TaxID=35806 RepID=A0A2W5N5P3_RHOSU|nr:MAG: hypothetical protein DI556_13285 [Rhodovulum sulfidophilum]